MTTQAHADRPPEWDEKRAHILGAAAKIFARFGYRKTTIEDIAEVAGMGKATLYYYFSGKEQIFLDVVNREGAALLDAVQAAVDAASTPAQKLGAFAHTHREHFISLKNLYSISHEVMRELTPVAYDVWQTHHDREMSMVGGILEDGIRGGELRRVDVKLTAFSILVSLRALGQELICHDREGAIEASVQAFIELILDGLRER